ncbi:DUF2254 domain-containing protein [Bacillus xiapuensis]|uniref:DUF2254 domain-containing protein n=1 Tax=Bacillus xiapuensis TaxID=2014075 RepID=UPI000C24E32A|nr:DUF2254 domain-containing protein [Bacillus xiapuensis]
MKERWDLKLKNNIWIIPSFYSFTAFLLAAVVIWLDISHYPLIKAWVPNRLLTSIGLAETILGAIAGSLLTMTSITFSTLMVVLTTYSGQFSPRTLQNFIRDKVTLRVLGIFMGGFVYSMFSLLFLRDIPGGHPVISAAVGVIIAFICLAFFAHFLQHVAQSIQVNKLIRQLTEDATSSISKMAQRIEKEKRSQRVFQCPVIEQKQVTVYTSAAYGFTQLYEIERLFDLACQDQCTVEILLPIGSFITRKTELMKIYHSQELTGNFIDAVQIGDDRTTMQDLEFGVQKLGEITLRALAPGANDPNTAIDGIKHMGMCLDEASHQDGRYIVYYEGEIPRLIIAQKPFEEVLYQAFYEICYSGRDRVSVLLAVFEALIEIANKNTENIKGKIYHFGEYVLNKVEEGILNKDDRKKLQEKFVILKKICKQENV